MIFSDFKAVFVKHSGLRWQKRTKKYGKRAKKTFLSLALTGPKSGLGVIGLYKPICRSEGGDFALYHVVYGIGQEGGDLFVRIKVGFDLIVHML